MAAVPSQFRLLRPLGRGSICTVYEAEWNRRPVAIKLLKREHRHDAGLALTIRNEVAAGTAVRHPNLVRIHAAIEHGLVMSRVTGLTLRQVLNRDGALPVWLVESIVAQCAEALAALHKAGFVHGDVKPENILLDTRGHATLIDLGFARRPGRIPAGQGLLGTPNYLAPELCVADYVDTSAADVFALGVTAFELCTTRLPYAVCDDSESTLWLHRETHPEWLAERSHLSKMINQMMQSELFQRPKASMLARCFGKDCAAA